MPYKNKEEQKEYHKKYMVTYIEKNRSKLYQYQKKYRENNPEFVRNSQIKCKYGITLEQYNEMFIIQNGCCSICGRHQNEFKKALHVDHDHITGNVRGLLCTNCNTILGMAHDEVDLLKNVIDYIERYNNYVGKQE
jgi:hypothetical protein